MKINKQKGGIIKSLIIIIALIALASFFFDFNVQEIVEDEQTQSNFSYIQIEASTLYNTYLSNIVDYVWNDFFIDIIWHNFMENRELVKEGKPTIFEQAIPSIVIPE